MASYLVTGSSRGLGLALVTHLTSFPTSEVGTIFATARTESDVLQELISKSGGRVVFVVLEATSEESIKDAVVVVERKLNGKGLDVLINNAGIMQWQTEGITKMTNLQEHLNTNVVGVQFVTAAFMPLLERGSLKKIANLSTTLGSIAKAKGFKPHGVHAYTVSKAALNMLTVQYALDYAEQGFTIFSISPGWLRTDLGGSMADLDVDVGAAAALDKIMGTTKEQNGEFMNIHVKGYEKREGPNQYDGANPPW